jgi:hypothetical protein
LQLKKRIGTIVAGIAIGSGLVVGAATPALAASWHYVGTYDNARCSFEAQKYKKPQCRPYAPGASQLWIYW